MKLLNEGAKKMPDSLYRFLLSCIQSGVLYALTVTCVNLFPLKNYIPLMRFKSSSKVLCQKTLQTGKKNCWKLI